MPFDPGAGLSQMGETVGKIAGLAALEQQKSGLEAERLKLAGDIASAGRKEQHGLDLETLQKKQEHESAENVLNRANLLEAHRISANASMAAAGAHLQAVQEQIKATERLGTFHINEDGTASMINVRSGVATPVKDDQGNLQKFDNPEKAKALSVMATVAREELTSTARLYETDLKQAQNELKVALDAAKTSAALDPAKDPGVIAARDNIEKIRAQYEPKIQTLSSRMQQFYNELGVRAKINTGAAPGAPALSDIIKVPGAAQPAAPEAPTLGTGMINGYGGPR